MTDPWDGLKRLTAARIGLGRVGASLPTAEVLRFGLAHARARDAVHEPADFDGIAAGLQTLGLLTVRVQSAAPDRQSYLRRPDLGRRLSPDSAAVMSHPAEVVTPRPGDVTSRAPVAAPAPSDHVLASDKVPAPVDVALIVADGLSATALAANALPFLAALLPLLRDAGLVVSPDVALVTNGRVAIGDEIGAALGARLALVLIGERPGLSAADSLGAYLTHAPRPGRTDAERNCISNIRTEGLPPAAAAAKACWLIRQSLRLGLSGVGLKDDETPSLPPPPLPVGN